MAKSQKNTRKKPALQVGARVLHNTDKTLQEGVVVCISVSENSLAVKNGTPLCVHWSNGKRGNYNDKLLSRINPITTCKQMKKQMKKAVTDGEES